MKLRSLRSFFPGLVCAALGLLAAPLARAQENAPAGELVEDTWNVVKLQGTSVGYSRTTVWKTRLGDRDCYRTDEESAMRIGRLGASIEIQTTARTYEDLNHQVFQLGAEMKMAESPTRFEAVVEGNVLHATSETMGRERSYDIPWDPEIVSSRRASELTAALLEEPAGTRRTYKLFDPTMASAITVTVEVKGPETIQWHGKSLKTTLVTSETSLLPGMVGKSWLDEEGEALRTVQPMMGGMGITTELSTREEALAAWEGKEETPDVFVDSVVKCDTRIPYPRRVEEALYRIVARPDVKPDWEQLAKDRRQVIEERGDGAILLRVRKLMPPPHAAQRPLQEVPAEIEDALAPSTTIQSDDPAIVALAQEVAGSETDAWTAAQALERWVYEHIDKKGFDVAFASASEVCKNGQGDCSEHAVLLAAMCRAAGIPARVAMGVVYFNGVFGGHAWTEVWTGDWYALDATTAHGGVGAAHLSMGRGTLSDQSGLELFAPIATFLGGIDVEVEELHFGDKVYRVGASADPFVVDGDRYTNELLGLALSKPADWEFDDLRPTGAMSADVLEIEAPEGDDQFRVSLQAVPYNFDMEELLEKAGGTHDPVAVKVDGRPAMQVDRNGSRTVYLLDEDSLLQFRTRNSSPAVLEQFEKFLESVDLDVGWLHEAEKVPTGSP